MENPLISFIIPVYNREQETAEAVQCLLESGLQSYEIILVNDASKDQSGKVCDAFSSKYTYIKTIHHAVNQGPGPARNHGMHLATGRYFYFLDSDDLVNCETLLGISEILSRNPDIDIITMNHMTITPSGEKEIRFFDSEMQLSADELLGKKPSILHTEMWRHLFKAELIRRYSLEVPSVMIGEDTCFVARAYLLASRVYVYPYVFCIHRHFPNDSLVESATRQQYVEGFEQCARILEQFCSERELTPAQSSAVDAYIYSCVIPLLRSIPLDELHAGMDRIRTLIGSESPQFHIDLKLYKRFGILGCAVYTWMALMQTATSDASRRELYLSPAGGVSAAVAEKLFLSGARIAGFLDNHNDPNNFYVTDAKKRFGGDVFSFDYLATSNGVNAFVVVLGSSNTALEIGKQLRDSGFQEQFISGISMDNYS